MDQFAGISNDTLTPEPKNTPSIETIGSHRDMQEHSKSDEADFGFHFALNPDILPNSDAQYHHESNEVNDGFLISSNDMLLSHDDDMSKKQPVIDEQIIRTCNGTTHYEEMTPSTNTDEDDSGKKQVESQREGQTLSLIRVKGSAKNKNQTKDGKIPMAKIRDYSRGRKRKKAIITTTVTTHGPCISATGFKLSAEEIFSWESMGGSVAIVKEDGEELLPIVCTHLVATAISRTAKVRKCSQGSFFLRCLEVFPL